MLNIINHRIKFFSFSIFLLIVSLFFIFFGKINLGIDMTGGTQAEYTYNGNLNIEEINKKFENIKNIFNEKNDFIINSTSIYGITGEQKVGVVVGYDSHLSEEKLQEVKTEFREITNNFLLESNNTFEESSFVNIGKSFGDYIKKTAKYTLIIALFSIAIYILFAFGKVVNGVKSYVFALVTGVTLLHDILLSVGIYIIISNFYHEFQIDTYTITALLTILGYSINDTIVVFDRIRANLREFGGRGKSLEEIVSLSLNQTIVRSLFTSLTLVFVLITIFFFGPEALRGFILIMIFGTIFGTYSSIFIASPLLYSLTKNNKIEIYKEIKISDEDKIIV
ncbi:MAG: protein translocase subunit SecF [Candidatus Gracilibacteria bacterium]|nr:protein translocase subunit SecF [Candidatus Gracilibacteria bacterium]